MWLQLNTKEEPALNWQHVANSAKVNPWEILSVVSLARPASKPLHWVLGLTGKFATKWHLDSMRG